MLFANSFKKLWKVGLWETESCLSQLKTRMGEEIIWEMVMRMGEQTLGLQTSFMERKGGK